MKKALLSVLTFILIFSSLFCLSACGGSKKVEVYLFDTEENRSWQYSEKVTFNLGEKSGEDKNIYAYFLENARKVKIKEEKLLRAEYFFRTTVYVDTDILDKTFDDQSLNTPLSMKQRSFWMPRRKRRKQTYSIAPSFAGSILRAEF